MAAMRKDVRDAAFTGSLACNTAAATAAATPTGPGYVTKLTVVNSRPKVKEDFSSPETPVPDYEDDSPPDPSSCGQSSTKHRNSFKFVNNFQNVISNIRTIEELHSSYSEPDPDYLNDEDSPDATSSTHHNQQQQLHQQRSPGWRKPAANSANGDNGSFEDFPPPPPPVTAEELSKAVSEAYDAQVQNGISPAAASDAPRDEAQQIKPKPLHNPCVESKERQALHKELLLNYKIGKDVLQKPELNKVLRERRETQKKKEWEEHKSSKGRTSLEVKLEERRIKEEEESKMKVIKEDETPELLRIHKKITHKTGGE